MSFFYSFVELYMFDRRFSPLLWERDRCICSGFLDEDREG